MKVFHIVCLATLLGCATTHTYVPHKSREVRCFDTLENCVKLVDDVCVRHYKPMMAEGPFEDGSFKVTFECVDK